MISKNDPQKKIIFPVGLIFLLILVVCYNWKTLLTVIFTIIVTVWNLLTPTSYTLFLYKDSRALKGTDVPDQQVSGYGDLRSCQEKGVEFTQKGYAKFTCGERCKNPAIGEIDCLRTFY